METLTIREVYQRASQALVGQGFTQDEAQQISHEFVAAEIAGVKTHGLGKLVSLNLGDIHAQSIITSLHNLLVVDGNRGNGFRVMRTVASRVQETALQYGLACAFVRNHTRYSSLYPYTQQLAERGLVAILSNTAGPSAVAPYGSIDPITGTNPLCIAVPTRDGPQIFDFATSEMVWGEIRQAMLEGRGVKYGVFLDAVGDITTMPESVSAVRAFGGSKGWALNLALEIICGLLSGAKAGTSVDSEFDCGAILLAFNPLLTGASSDFPDRVADLLNEVRGSRPEQGFASVRCPGDYGPSKISIDERLEEHIDVPEVTLRFLDRMGRGEVISELSSNPLTN